MTAALGGNRRASLTVRAQHFSLRVKITPPIRISHSPAPVLSCGTEERRTATKAPNKATLDDIVVPALSWSPGAGVTDGVVAFVPFVVGVVRFCANAGAESNDRNSTSANRNRREEEEKAVVGAIVLCDGR